ncbi:MAG: 50S ribosomal protein L19e [Candidatus ainarchaeum sp.]|nr:50S ribosomal protein L19e [Candidatus ainarchaeum sp.]
MKSGKIKIIAARVLKCGSNRVWFNPEEAEKVKSAMTKEDVKALIQEGIIRKKKANAQSMGRARILSAKKKRGRKRSFGSRRGLKSARSEKRRRWIGRVRALRSELKKLKKENPKAVEKIGYRKIYRLVKGNFFKGRRYLDAFVEGKEKK